MRTLMWTGLISFNWDHTRNKPLDNDNRYYREHRGAPEQEHHHQEQVRHPLPSRPREDAQTVRHGTEDHTSAAAASTARSGYATAFSRMHCSHGRRWQE